MKTNNIFANTVIPAKAGIQTEDLNPVSLDPRLRGGDGKKNVAVLLAIASFLLTASFVFADPVPPMAISLPDGVDVFKVENDQSVPKTERIATIEYKPKSSVYVLRGRVRHHEIEGESYFQVLHVMPDGSRYYSRTLTESEMQRRIPGTNGWREFELPFNLMGAKPELVTLEIDAIMRGKGTIEVTELTVSDLSGIDLTSAFRLPASGEWFDARTGNMGGGIGGTLMGCYGALFGILCGILVPLGKGKRLLYGMILFAFVMGVFSLVVGITAVFCGQPYHVWYPFVLLGGITIFVFPAPYLTIRQQYAQVELRKMQALDA